MHKSTSRNAAHLAASARFYTLSNLGRKRVLRLSAAAAATVVLLTQGPAAKAAAVVFATPVTIAGDTDVNSAGTLAYAYDFNGTAGNNTVNNVTFTGQTGFSGSVGSLTLSGFQGNHTPFGGSGTGFSGLSTQYQNTITGGDYNAGANATVTLNSLTAGHAYVTQFWVTITAEETGGALKL